MLEDAPPEQAPDLQAKIRELKTEIAQPDRQGK